MAEAAANPLIMALRANTAPSGAMPPGVKNLSFPWQTNNTGPLVIPNRPAIKPKATAPTPPATPPAAPPVTPPVGPPNGPVFPPNFDPRLSPDGRLPYQDMRIEADAPMRDGETRAAAPTMPVTDEMSVRQTLEQILADNNPQTVVPPPAASMPQIDIPAFDSEVNFEMPADLFATPAPFVPGFTPDADVYAAMQSRAPIVQEPEPIDPALLAMLGGQPVPASQPVPEEPMYGAQVPAWYFDEFGFDGTR